MPLITCTALLYDSEPVQFVLPAAEQQELRAPSPLQAHLTIVTCTTRQHDCDPVEFSLTAVEQEEIINDVCNISQLLAPQFRSYKHRCMPTGDRDAYQGTALSHA